MEIKLSGQSKRGKERIQQHSKNGVFRLLRTDMFRGEKAILVESMIDRWCGWFTSGEVVIENNHNFQL